MKVCKYYKKGNCYLVEMENTQLCGVEELDKVHPCPFHPSYEYFCFEDAMNNSQVSKK